MIKHYKHTQIGYFTIITLTIGLIVFIGLLSLYGFNLVVLIVLLILIICLLLFATLKVVIEKDILEIKFGIGIIKKKFNLKDIKEIKIVKNPWYYGWGIHKTSKGWLYNVSGFYAVEISMKSGSKYRIGTDVPKVLEKAIREFIKKN